MSLTTTASLKTATTTRECPVCHKRYESETCFLDGKELFALREAICDECDRVGKADVAKARKSPVGPALHKRWTEICPPDFINTDPARLPNRRAMREILEWQYGPQGILAHGETGMGKSRCLYLLLRRLHFTEQRQIVAMDAADFALECSRLFASDQAKAHELIYRLMTVKVLMIDDLDKARFTDRVEAEVWHIVNYRSRHHLPTLTSMNVAGEQLAELMTEHRGYPTVRRLREYAKAVDFDKT